MSKMCISGTVHTFTTCALAEHQLCTLEGEIPEIFISDLKVETPPFSKIFWEYPCPQEKTLLPFLSYRERFHV